MRTFEVQCPGCDTILIIDAKTGDVLEHRKPLLGKDATTGNRFDDARKRVESAGDRIAKKVAEAQEAERTKMARLNALFNERKSEIQESGEPLERPEGFGDHD